MFIEDILPLQRKLSDLMQFKIEKFHVQAQTVILFT